MGENERASERACEREGRERGRERDRGRGREKERCRGLLRRRDATGLSRKGCDAATTAEGATKWRARDGDFSLFK